MVDCWGDNGNGQAAGQPGPYTQVSAGSLHVCALTPSGAVDCWGTNDFGETTDQPGPYTAVSVGERHSCALTPAGAIDCWGDNDDGQAADQPGPYYLYSPANLIITKEVSGPDAPATWSFDFTGDLGPFTIEKGSPSITFNDVVPGDYTINETAAAGFEASVQCDNGDDSPNGNLTVTLDPGATVTCTFTNEKTAVPAGFSVLLPAIIR